MKVECYVEQSTKALRKMDRGIGFVLECRIRDSPITITGFSQITATGHAAELTAIKAALGRMRKPADITIHTEDIYVLTYIDMIDELAGRGFRKADGTPLQNRNLWKEIYDLAKPHNLTVKVGSHQYSGWIRSEIKRRGLDAVQRKQA